ncbi:MAG: LytTR family DNA-binding domain-containing protein [Pseudomonadota bacterium]
MNILIVDDEPLARERLKQLVTELNPDYELYEASNGLDALTIITNQSIDIILLDIRMPRMDGMELASHILKMDQQPAIVFCTAFQDHAVKAFEANAVDYLLKPIRKERLQIALDKASLLTTVKLNMVTQTDSSITARSHLSTLVNGNLELIPIDKIYYFKAEQKYVPAAWPVGQAILDDSLVSLEQEFAEYFIRIHRNTLVAKHNISGLIKNEENQLCIKLSSMDELLLVSRRHLSSVKTVVQELTHR